MKNNQAFDISDLLEEYRNKLLTFYAPHFEDEKSLTAFVELAFNYHTTGAHKKGLYQKRFGHLSEQVG